MEMLLSTSNTAKLHQQNSSGGYCQLSQLAVTEFEVASELIVAAAVANVELH